MPLPDYSDYMTENYEFDDLYREELKIKAKALKATKAIDELMSQGMLMESLIKWLNRRCGYNQPEEMFAFIKSISSNMEYLVGAQIRLKYSCGSWVCGIPGLFDIHEARMEMAILKAACVYHLALGRDKDG